MLKNNYARLHRHCNQETVDNIVSLVFDKLNSDNFDFSNCETVYEDNSYSISLFLDFEQLEEQLKERYGAEYQQYINEIIKHQQTPIEELADENDDFEELDDDDDISEDSYLESVNSEIPEDIDRNSYQPNYPHFLSFLNIDGNYRTINNITLSLNDKQIGYAEWKIIDESKGSKIKCNVFFNTVNGGKNSHGSHYESVSPCFALQYDLISLAINLTFTDKSSCTLYTEPMLCAISNNEDSENIRQIAKDLTSLDNNEILSLMFQPISNLNEYDNQNNLQNHNSYKDIGAYINLLKEISKCYRDNYNFFKTHAHHVLEQEDIPVSYNKVKSVNAKNFRWLTQNLDVLTKVDPSIGFVNIDGESYIPTTMQSTINKKSYDVVENRILISFLQTVLYHAINVSLKYKDLINDVQQRLGQSLASIKSETLTSEAIISSLEKANESLSKAANEENVIDSNLNDNDNLSTEVDSVINDAESMLGKKTFYLSPILTIKSTQLRYYARGFEYLNQTINDLKLLQHKYSKLFGIKNKPLDHFPRRTPIFQEIKPYAESYQQVLNWFSFGNFSVDKDKTFLKVATIDRLFEYYCLYRLLDMLIRNGFEPSEELEPFSFQYQEEGYYKNFTEVANTYILQRGDLTATLYYQPMIGSNHFENNLYLFRTTSYAYDSSGRNFYYTPDFVLKFSYGSQAEKIDEDYIIFDSKFSNVKTVKNQYMGELLRKYSFEMAVATFDRTDHKHSDKITKVLPAHLNRDIIEESITGEKIRIPLHEYEFAKSKAPKMIFALQGRISKTKKEKEALNDDNAHYLNQDVEQPTQANTPVNEASVGSKDEVATAVDGSNVTNATPSLVTNSKTDMTIVNSIQTNTTSDSEKVTKAISSDKNKVWLYHNSPLSRLIPPPTTVGIVAFNTFIDATPNLWAHLERNLPYLKSNYQPRFKVKTVS